MRRQQALYPHRDIKLYDGPGISKARNVRTGFDNARGEILMILDADLTTMPEELPLQNPDPADRFLAATAEILNLTFVTADHRLLGLGKISTLANR